jgi:methylthioribose-1-phosphate isomerase
VGDVIEGPLRAKLAGASSDLRVHRGIYGSRGPGAIVHAHPAGTVPEEGGGPGLHGVYVFGDTLEEAAEEAVRASRHVRRSAPPSHQPVEPLHWTGQAVRILDQRQLPAEERFIEACEPDEVAEAIRSMALRGAPLLGLAGAFGVALAAVRSPARAPRALLADLERAARVLVASRPTAANIAWAVRRVLDATGAAAEAGAGSRGAGRIEAIRTAAVEEAVRIAEEDAASCQAIGRFGAGLVPARAGVLTHCNTGALATGGVGTAQAIIAAAHGAGKRVHVWVDETRPVLQGARLTAWELQRLGIPMTLVADNAAGSLMARGLVDLVVVGADRIAANGDVANKVGTYQLAVLAGYHRIPFFVAAPLSTLDPDTPTGDEIAIEQRDPAEVTAPLGIPLAPEGTSAANPAFDVTPSSLITAIVTDRGVARPPFPVAFGRLVGDGLSSSARRRPLRSPAPRAGPGRPRMEARG